MWIEKICELRRFHCLRCLHCLHCHAGGSRAKKHACQCSRRVHAFNVCMRKARVHMYTLTHANLEYYCTQSSWSASEYQTLIKLAAYTDEKLKSIDEYYSTRDFAACNLTRLPAHNKVQLLRRLLDIFTRDLPARPWRHMIWLWSRLCMTRTKESRRRMRYGTQMSK